MLRSCLDRKYGFEEIVGSSPPLLAALDVATRMAATDATVLIYGETGTGKELVAKAIHLRSNRRERHFMTINCGAIPRELLESELFGHVKGSFTGALTHKKGKVEMADGGTLLLDEIGEMPLELQVRILRLIQEREIEKVGATSPTKVDVRIIAATHRNLATMVERRVFPRRSVLSSAGGPDHRAAAARTARRYPGAGAALLPEVARQTRTSDPLHALLGAPPVFGLRLAGQCPPIGECRGAPGPARQRRRGLAGRPARFPPPDRPTEGSARPSPFPIRASAWKPSKRKSSSKL